MKHSVAYHSSFGDARTNAKLHKRAVRFAQLQGSVTTQAIPQFNGIKNSQFVPMVRQLAGK